MPITTATRPTAVVVIATPEPAPMARTTFDAMPPNPANFYERQCIRWKDLTPEEKQKYNKEWDAWEAELRADRQPILDADAAYCDLLRRYNDLAAIFPKLPPDAIAAWQEEIGGVTDKLSEIMEEKNNKIYAERLGTGTETGIKI